MTDDIKSFEFTDAAWNSLYDAVDDVAFQDRDAQLIYDSLRINLKAVSFGEYLKRYIYLKAEINGAYDEIPLKEYQLIIRYSFSDNHTPPSFEPTTAKLSALSKNWLTQQTVKRKVVFLLGFGLNMSVEDVNRFLTKALREPEINPKDPFEVICWYCYKNGYNFLKFEKLMAIYNDTPANTIDMGRIYSEHTIGLRNTMYSIHNDAALIAHLSKLKGIDGNSLISITAMEHFVTLYDETRDLIAKLYNQTEETEHSIALNEYIQRLSNNTRLSDDEKRIRIEQFRSKKHIFTRQDISESDIERVLYAAVPIDRHGNLSPSRLSTLSGQFSGKRFSRQRISDILSGRVDVSRFDLITLLFFVYSQKTDSIPDSKTRYTQFYEKTNAILEKCFMGGFYVQNPYECFVLMCMLSEDPLGTYADVWELSYSQK